MSVHDRDRLPDRLIVQRAAEDGATAVVYGPEEPEYVARFLRNMRAAVGAMGLKRYRVVGPAVKASAKIWLEQEGTKS